MTAHQNVGTPPDTRADRAPLHRGRRRPAMRWIAHSVLFVALAVGIFCLLPRLGGLTRDAAGLRHARPAFLVAAIVAQAVSLGCYAQLYRRVLAALGADPVPAGRGRHPGHLLRQSPNPVRFGDRQKESPPRRRLADRIPSINFCRTRCVPRVAKHLAGRDWAVYPTLKPIAR